ncbi:unnamed protein product [Phaedon cochleariae]|uniref:BTB domain-containing protein n=1 Tax=Phaedon cochleariae TaxID=80249 RepID=A0A9P0DL39_PHACE|nr:unnamed protein product [Phaedon cochleariae]
MGESTNIVGKPVEVGSGRCMSIQAMQALFELKENNQLCDATIVLDDGAEIPVHRAILCACSSYFRALFTTTLHNREKNKVQLPGVTSEMLQILLVYIYLRKLDINQDNVYSLLITADYLSILGVLDLCCKFLENNLNSKNCIGVLIFARNHFCRELGMNSWKYIMKNFTQIASESDEILTLSLSEIQEIINSDDLNVKSEETVWETILRWIDHDTEARKKHIVSLMRCIRLGLLDTQFFLERVKEHAYVSGCEESRPMIIETLKFLYDLEMITHRYIHRVIHQEGPPLCLPYIFIFGEGQFLGFGFNIPLNIDKCSILHVGPTNPELDYHLDKKIISAVENHNDLGVIFNKKLSVSNQVAAAVGKANSRTYLLNKCFHHPEPRIFDQLHKAYVRPHLEYAVQIWFLHLVKDIQLLERAQRNATRMVKSFRDLSYEQLLSRLSLPLLSDRRASGDAILTYRILHDDFSVDLSNSFHLQNDDRLRGHTMKLKQDNFRTTLRQKILSNRVFSKWNALPRDVVSAPSVSGGETFIRHHSPKMLKIFLCLGVALNLASSAIFNAIDNLEEDQPLPNAAGTLKCHRKLYTYLATQMDDNGKQCWDKISVWACWGRCDSNEISDWRFPFKKSNHPVCVHHGRNRVFVTLRHCEEGVKEGTDYYEYYEADQCKCQICSSTDTSCEGVRYRPQRSDPDSERFGFRFV